MLAVEMEAETHFIANLALVEVQSADLSVLLHCRLPSTRGEQAQVFQV
jgi:hypothetical protein